MSTHDPMGDAPFVRPESVIDRDFTLARNEWLRDSRITGNALSVYLYVMSHAAGFRVTQPLVRSKLHLGRTAFETARDKLEASGYLRVTKRRYPAGATDSEGRSIAGHTQISFEFLDPFDGTAAHKSADQNRMTGDPSYGGEPVDKPMHETNIGSSEPVDKPMHETHGGFPAAGFVPHKKTKDQEDQEREDHHRRENASISTIDDDLSPSGHVSLEDKALAVFAPKLSGAALRAELLNAGIDPDNIRLILAASEVLKAAPGEVGAPNRYVAQAIINQPGRWAREPAGVQPRRPSEPMCPTCLSYELRDGECWACGPAASGLDGALGVSA